MQEPGDELIPTQASLLLRLKDWRDQASWQRFFDTYWRLIYGVARQSGLNDVESQEVVQETMVAVANHMPSFKYDPAKGSFKTWLLNMTRWRIIDQVRKRTRGVARDSLASFEGETGTNVIERVIDPAGNALDALWEAEWQNTLLQAALASVKRRVEPQNYQLFDFYVNKGWAAAKVAQTFNVDVNQVYMAKHRVTEMLTAEVARLDREGS